MMHFNTTGMAVGLGGAQLGGPAFGQGFGQFPGSGSQFNVPLPGGTPAAATPSGIPLPSGAGFTQAGKIAKKVAVPAVVPAPSGDLQFRPPMEFPTLPPPPEPLDYTFNNWLNEVYKKQPGKPYEEFKQGNAALKEIEKQRQEGKLLDFGKANAPKPYPDYTYDQFLKWQYGIWDNAQKAKQTKWASWAKYKNDFLASMFGVKPNPRPIFEGQYKTANPSASAEQIEKAYVAYWRNFEVSRLANYWKGLYDQKVAALKAAFVKKVAEKAYLDEQAAMQKQYYEEKEEQYKQYLKDVEINKFKQAQALMAEQGLDKSAGVSKPNQFGFAGFKPQQVQVKVTTVKPIAKVETPAETPPKGLAQIAVPGASSASQVFLRSDGIAVNQYSQPWDAVDEKGNISDPVLGAEAGFTVSPVEVGVGDLNGKLAFASTDGKQVFGYVKRVPYKGSFVLQNEPLPKQPEPVTTPAPAPAPVTTPAAPVGGGGGGGGGGTGWGGPVFAKEPEPTVVLPPPAVPVQKSALPLLALLAAGAYALSR